MVTKVRVCGIVCDFSDMRIDKSTVPEGRYQYEVADDDESQGDPVRVREGIMVNFFGTLISDVPLPLGVMGYCGWMMGRVIVYSLSF